MKAYTKMLAIAAVAVVVVAAVGYAVLTRNGGKKTLLLATTTSTYDSGLLGYILPDFEKKYDCTVEVIAVGSGQALELGKNGDADVLLVHSPSAELTFMAGGYGESRTLVMYNNFVVVGPASDPAGVAAAKNTTQAFLKIYENGTAGFAKFLSRADGSGTYSKEVALWKAAGLNSSTFPTGSWYEKTGQGMGAVLDMCEQEDNAYTLSDDATYYQRTSESLIPHLNMTYKGDKALFNQYSVIPVNSTKWPNVNHTLAVGFKDWIVSQEGQDLIAGYKKYDHQLFFPNAPGYGPRTTVLKGGPVSEDLGVRPDMASSTVFRIRSGADVA